MKKVLVTIFLSSIIFPALSQKYDEVGFFVGGSYFMGDVHSQLKDNSHLSAGVMYRKNFNERWAIRYDLRYAKISGDDANASNPFEVQRNLSFQSNIWELSSVIEFNFFDFDPYKPVSFFQPSDVFTPYVFLGLSAFIHNPKGDLAGNIYELRPLQTEGVSYTKWSVAIPFGVGLKFRASDRLLIGVSYSLHTTFTDYLDDVSTRYPSDPSEMGKTARDLSNRSLESQSPGGQSWGAQRGNSYNFDWISYLGVSVSINLRKNPSSCHFNPSN